VRQSIYHRPEAERVSRGSEKAGERVFADAKEKHAMRYTHYRGLAQASNWVRLKFAAMNLKKLARWKARNRFAPSPSIASSCILSLTDFAACLVIKPDRPFFDKQTAAFSGCL